MRGRWRWDLVGKVGLGWRGRDGTGEGDMETEGKEGKGKKSLPVSAIREAECIEAE